jgi:hypothetical protein
MTYKKIIYKAMYHIDRFRYPSSMRSSNPFSTHLPILASLGQLVKPKKILELGSGNYSSRLFLDTSYFQFVEKVDSFENDERWAAAVLKNVGSDHRFNLTCDEKHISIQVADLNLEDYDLIFIDDSIDSIQRSATIKLIASKKPSRAICVVHDFDHYPYRDALSGFKNRFRFDALNPHTGVAWNNGQIEIKKLQFINKAIKTYYAKTEVVGEDALLENLRSFINSIDYEFNK